MQITRQITIIVILNFFDVILIREKVLSYEYSR